MYLYKYIYIYTHTEHSYTYITHIMREGRDHGQLDNHLTCYYVEYCCFSKIISIHYCGDNHLPAADATATFCITLTTATTAITTT